MAAASAASAARCPPRAASPRPPRGSASVSRCRIDQGCRNSGWLSVYDLCTRSSLIGKKGDLVSGTGSSQHSLAKNIRELKSLQDAVNQDIDVSFVDEMGVDQGGLSQELFRIAAKILCQPNTGTFRHFPSGLVWFPRQVVAQASSCEDNRKKKNRKNCKVGRDLQDHQVQPAKDIFLIGTLCGMALFNRCTVPFPFPRALYKKLLDLTPTLEDLEDLLPTVGRNLWKILNEECDSLDLDFTKMEEDSTDVVELKENGANIPVTKDNRLYTLSFCCTCCMRAKHWQFVQAVNDMGVLGHLGICIYRHLSLTGKFLTNVKSNLEQYLQANTDDLSGKPSNRKEYVDLYVNYMFNKSVQKPFEDFVQGFLRGCPARNWKMFLPEELQVLLQGHETFDWHLLEKNVMYGGYDKLDQTIRNFWTVFHELPEEKKKMFLAFLTGSDRITGYGSKRFGFWIVDPQGENPDELSPHAITCQFILFLPRYSSKKILKKKLLYAIEHNEGFGMT